MIIRDPLGIMNWRLIKESIERLGTYSHEIHESKDALVGLSKLIVYMNALVDNRILDPEERQILSWWLIETDRSTEIEEFIAKEKKR